MPLLTIEIAGDRPPRYGCGARLPFIVGRGPVPRHAAIAGETRSDARMASEGPALRVLRPPSFTVGRGPVPRHAAIARPCRSRSPEALASMPSDLDPFVIRRSQTTEGETHIVTMEIAGETRSDARVASEGPRATGKSRPGGLSYRKASAPLCSLRSPYRK